MNIIEVNLNTLKPHPQNPNTHPAKQITELGKSLTRFGQPKNIVVWRGRIIAGHGLVEAAREIGWATLQAEDVSDWDEQRAIEFMLADNRLPEMGLIDNEALLDALAVIDVPVEVPGFDEEFLKGIGFGDEMPDVEFREYDEGVEGEVEYITCPHCGEKFPK